ncbi:MAG: M28 family metallopeptidase [Vicinamibacterales bacterium]
MQHAGNRNQRSVIAACLLLATTALAAQQAEIDRWWSHVVFLSDDSMQGRQTGSPEHRKAAEYVAEQFRKAGLKPGAGTGYLQTVDFVSRQVVEDQSSLAIVRDGVEVPIALGDEAMLNMRVDHAPSVDAPMVFAGHGLVIPEIKHDDLAGLDLKGTVAVVLTGLPPGSEGPLGAHYSQQRWQTLRAAGAIGTLQIQNPKGQDVPWERQMPTRFLPQMALADRSMDDGAGQLLNAPVNPARAEKLFAGSGHTFAEILDLAHGGKPLPKFPLQGRIRSKVTVTRTPGRSHNVVGILPGTDPKLRNEYIVVTAHLDHLGTGNPVNGDGIYNGAMDNASGVATLIETAGAAAAKKGFKRAVAFVAVTAEEKGLLGSRYFAQNPTLPAGSIIVANLNTDMFLPLFPLKSLVVAGFEESDLAADLQKVAKQTGIAVMSDPEPERNAFTRSDQYSFIRRGIPALSLKVGFVRDSPEHEIVRTWRKERYHGVRDDISQPLDKQAAVDFNRLYLAVVEAVANRPTRPAWNGNSFFRRFAPQTSE